MPASWMYTGQARYSREIRITARRPRNRTWVAIAAAQAGWK